MSGCGSGIFHSRFLDLSNTFVIYIAEIIQLEQLCNRSENFHEEAIPVGDFSLVNAYGCLHSGESQSTQNVNKKFAINQRFLRFHSKISLHAEVDRMFEKSAHAYFTDSSASRHMNVEVILAYYFYGYFFDQLALIEAGNNAFSIHTQGTCSF